MTACSLPGEPGNPWFPGAPGRPGMPPVGSPGGPGGPVMPGKPSTPRSPFKPGTPIRPSSPEEGKKWSEISWFLLIGGCNSSLYPPGRPGIPGVPGRPLSPGNPGEPSLPGFPEVAPNTSPGWPLPPGIPGRPSFPLGPSKPSPGLPGSPGSPLGPGKPVEERAQHSFIKAIHTSRFSSSKRTNNELFWNTISLHCYQDLLIRLQMHSYILTLWSRLATKTRVSPFSFSTIQPWTPWTSRETWLTFRA